MDTIVTIRGLSKRFGTFSALKNVNLDIRAGEVLGFIGPNGAGKSTTIRLLLGILKPSSGTAKIFGEDVWSRAVEIHRRIAYVPGDVNLWPNLTGGEIIDLFIKLQGSGDVARRDELIGRFELDPSKKSRTYSKGNRQKVALIAAFASDADLFILDEPTSGLDPLMERVFQECVEEIKAKGKSVLLSSHILSEVERLCDRVAIIREGEIIETGTLEELRHLTRSLFQVETRIPADRLSTFPGVHDLEQTERKAVFQVDSEQVGVVLEYLTGLGVMKLESMPPTLEDLFMRHYEKQGGRQGASHA
ncbi:ABC transporter ATP-binding protein [Paenibacillus brevis]|uniref:ABC transporter ATP-binding protein n=1 Tax=Paenibacillus brevis TaxID=2841508 RepID=A0ABS6FP21_9BACL|nr:ABC transporter ATP-binding protein [Paenibacillus brevis]MBU5671696.1 ABC transporter ATP-binding protein [Paenibacillus brevis]